LIFYHLKNFNYHWTMANKCAVCFIFTSWSSIAWTNSTTQFSLINKTQRRNLCLTKFSNIVRLAYAYTFHWRSWC
jgi:hypothetical protein